MMQEATERSMDEVVRFISGKLLTITGSQGEICGKNQMINLLVSSNRYGYIFYATKTDGLVIIPSEYIDQECRHLSKSSEDDDDDDGNNENINNEKPSIIHRSYIPGQAIKTNSSVIPYWIALNADETILSIVLLQVDSRSWIIMLYDVVKFIQIPDSTPIWAPIRLSNDSIQNFAWNPAIPNIFAILGGDGSISGYTVDRNAKQPQLLGKTNPNPNNSSICWSPKGKQIVVVQVNGTLESYDQNMVLKKTYPSIVQNSSFPTCISVLWLANQQFLLGFSDEIPNGDDNYDGDVWFQILATYDKDQPSKAQTYHDFFFDIEDDKADINSQYFYARLSENKTIISGLSKSSKINIIGPSETNQNT